MPTPLLHVQDSVAPSPVSLNEAGWRSPALMRAEADPESTFIVVEVLDYYSAANNDHTVPT